jgi:radical SAM protein with 4Fe4S-binding SPASM domain
VHSFLDNFPKANPEPYLAAIFKFVDEALLQRPDLYINFRLWDLHSGIELSEAQQSIVEKISAKYNFRLEPPKSVKQRKSIRITGRLYAHFDTEFVWPSLEQPRIGEIGTCYGLTSHIGVLVDGTVVPCCLDKEGTLRLGSLKTHALSEILSGYRADRMKQNFKSGRLIEPLCQRCQYVTRFTAKTVERIAVAASGRPT